jgi:hypothetical protein
MKWSRQKHGLLGILFALAFFFYTQQNFEKRMDEYHAHFTQQAKDEHMPEGQINAIDTMFEVLEVNTLLLVTGSVFSILLGVAFLRVQHKKDRDVS